MTEECIVSDDKRICACGCGTIFDTYDDRGRIRKFIHGHNGLLHKKHSISKSCDCGCGRLVNSGNFRRGHGRRIHFVDRSMMIPCKCGCGEMINAFDKLSRPIRYKRNHHVIGKKYPKIVYESRSGKYSNLWTGGKYKASDKYILIYKPQHPFSNNKGYVREHRLVVEECLSDLLGNRLYIDTAFEVHHINERRDDNRIENLQLMTKRDHNIYHGKNKKFWEYSRS